MFAVIKTGGKQYRVAADQTITIERIGGAEGSRVEFGQVLMVGEGSDVSVGAPAVEGARVTAEVIEQGRGPKTISFKKRRRQNSRRKKGHRQLLTTVSILEILTGGASPTRDGSGRSAEDRRRERDAAYIASREGVSDGVSEGTSDGVSEGDATGADSDAAGLVSGSAAPAASATAASGSAENDAASEHDEEQAAMSASAPAAGTAASSPEPEEAERDGDEGEAGEGDTSTAAIVKEAAEGAAVGAAVGAAAGAAVAAGAALAGDDVPPRPDGPLFTAPEGEKDKLTKIKGIGPVAERQLNEQGITTFKQIAELNDEEIEKVDTYMPFSAAQIRSWQSQARELAS